MNDRPTLSDDLLQAMLIRRAGHGAPQDLAASIAAALETLPDESRPWWSVLVPSSGRTQAARVAWVLILVGLLIATTVSVVLVGSQVLRRPSDLALVPAPTATPTPGPSPSAAGPDALPPLVLRPIGEPTVSDSSLGTITWQVYEGAVGVSTGTSHGPVGLVDNDLRWLDSDGAWPGLALPWEASPLTVTDGALFTYAAGSPRELVWDGDGWVVGAMLDVPDAVRPVEQIARGPRGTIVFGEVDFAIARDGEDFVATARPPVALDPNEPFVLATSDGFVALVTTDQARWDHGTFEPIPWFTADGTTWEPASATSPFGEGAWINSVAGRDGRFVAVGHVGNSQGPWTAWVSDDGRAWERLADLGELGASLPSSGGLRDGFPFVGVTAGGAGWVIYAKDGSAWVSPDGRTWEPLADWPAVRGMGWSPPVLVVAGDAIVAVGYRPGARDGGMVVGTIVRPGGGGG